MRIIVVFSISLFLLCSCGGFLSTTRVAPIRLTVVDSETGLPLSGISVYNVLRKGRLVSPVGDTEYYTIELEKLITDANGQITIPARSYSHRPFPFEYIPSRHFIINLVTDDGRMPTRMDFSAITSTFLSDRLSRGIVLANEVYFATVAYIWGSLTSELRDTDRATSRNFRRYDFDGLFSQRELQITVTLARNR